MYLLVLNDQDYRNTFPSVWIARNGNPSLCSFRSTRKAAGHKDGPSRTDKRQSETRGSRSLRETGSNTFPFINMSKATEPPTRLRLTRTFPATPGQPDFLSIQFKKCTWLSVSSEIHRYLLLFCLFKKKSWILINRKDKTQGKCQSLMGSQFVYL